MASLTAMIAYVQNMDDNLRFFLYLQNFFYLTELYLQIRSCWRSQVCVLSERTHSTRVYLQYQRTCVSIGTTAQLHARPSHQCSHCRYSFKELSSLLGEFALILTIQGVNQILTRRAQFDLRNL